MKAETKGGLKIRIAYLAILAVALPFAAVAKSIHATGKGSHPEPGFADVSAHLTISG
jgi:hypothetical protein